MRFADFLRSTVLLSAGAATVLAAVAVAGINDVGDDSVAFIAVVWWVVAVGFGTWAGRASRVSGQIGTLLADARMQMSLPEMRPGRTLLNRLWPLLVCTVAAGAVAFLVPQIPAVASGFAIIWALAWRRQSSAVRAIEDRDGARFYVDHTSPLQPIRLVRTPGFRTTMADSVGPPPPISHQTP